MSTGGGGSDLEFARYRELLFERDWGVLSKRLFLFAFRYGRHHADWWPWAEAEDAAQEAICQLFDPATEPRWDPAVEPDLYLFLCRPVANLVAGARRKRLRTVSRS